MSLRVGISVLISSGVVAGCCAFGPCDIPFRVTGAITSPEDANCILLVVSDNEDGYRREREVSGSFSESMVLYPNSDGYRITLICEGNTIYTGEYSGEYELNIGSYAL